MSETKTCTLVNVNNYQLTERKKIKSKLLFLKKLYLNFQVFLNNILHFKYIMISYHVIMYSSVKHINVIYV